MDILKLKIEHIPFLKIFAFYVLGILIANLIKWSESLYYNLIYLTIILFLFCLLLNLFQLLRRYQYFLHILLFLLGLISIGTHLPKVTPDLENDNLYLAQLMEDPTRSGQVLKFKSKLYIEKQGRKNKYAELKIITSIWDKDSAILHLNKGDLICFKGKIQLLPPPYNPSQFDYSQYLKNKGIYYQVFIPIQNFKSIKHFTGQEGSFQKAIKQIQNSLQVKFKEFIPSETSFQIASAITFGFRSNLSPQVFDVFSNTGTIHVLSVSGFHVSLMYLLFTMILSPLDRIPNGRQIRFSFILIFIWFYALICGFVPAVLRATLMFSLFLIGYWKNRVILSLNAVFSSAFLLLVYDPFMIFDIGFQLSYLAVLGILTFVPLFNQLYSRHNWLYKSFYNLVSVSIAAQLTTTPLAIYYFHQFPTYFLLSNIFITIPSTLILYLGSILVFIPWIKMSQFFGSILDVAISITYKNLAYIDSLPLSNIQGIQLNKFECLVSYIGVFAIFIAFRTRCKRTLIVSIFCINLVLSMVLMSRIKQKDFNGLKIYNTGKQISFAFINRGNVQLFSSFDSLSHKNLRYSVFPDLKKYTDIKENTFKKLSSDHLNHSINFQDKMSIFISNEKYNGFQNPELLFIRNNTDLPDKLNATLTIFDGSNSVKHIQKCIHLLEAENRSYYILKDNFAYVWESDRIWKKPVYPF